ncbi:MAG: hypothetical protein HC769_03405 [Cyanobacteria bacterium CRU_2_1]|nr:hypothetical protein [Cyanobacteria bacterium RU_5_0]NJR57976.1 hypothetical protein [Cyanobacteria bacterium CRU_2_1]
MSEQEKIVSNGEAVQTAAPKPGSLDLAEKPKSSNGQSELGLTLASKESKGGLQVGSFSSAGLRPIVSDTIEIFGTILNNRPIVASHLRVLEMLPGNRPVFASEMIVRDDLTLPGGRPIVASDPKLLQASLLPGGRPIASNEIDDPVALMGFLD